MLVLSLLACVRFEHPEVLTPTESVVIDSDSEPTDPTESTPTETDDSTPTDTDDSTTTIPKVEPKLVMMVTQDAMNRLWYGWREEERGWDTTPYQDFLLADGVVLPDVLMSRALTGPSMATIATGYYPRHHGVRDNGDAWGDYVPTMQDAFRAAGYYTVFITANRCELGEQREPDFGWDYFACTYRESDTGGPTQKEADATNVELVIEQLDLHPDQDLFVWVHFMNPHEDYEVVEPHYSEFQGEPYQGTLDAAIHASLDAVSTGQHGWDEEDRRYIEAAYASEVRDTDDRIEEIMIDLHQRDRFKEAIIVLGSDHGQENGSRPDPRYFYHGCTYYNDSAMTQWFFKSPGLEPGVLSGYIPSVDIVPTILDLAGIEADTSEMDGVSLRPNLETLTDPGRESFVERSAGTAGVVYGDYKYMLNPAGDFIECTPYSREFPYTTPAEELYNITVDPLETTNLVDSQPGVVTDMKARLCAYVNAEVWSGSTTSDATNAIVRECD